MAELIVEGLRKRFGDTWAINDVSFAVERGECLALLGPSGCGKTTTLRCVAGLEDPEGGRICISGTTVFGPGHRTVPTEHRGIGLVFQSYALWPHMTVFDNVWYPLRVRRISRRAASERVMSALAVVGLQERAGAYPSELSGGQQQRVALARNIAMSPGVLLFDEPLSNLDQRLREEMRFELRNIIDRLGVTALYVTHDQQEAFAVADRMAVMLDGRVQQLGTPAEIYGNPANDFVSQFVGRANTFDARVIDVRGGLATLLTDAGLRLRSSQTANLATGERVKIMVRPECLKVELHDESTNDDRFAVTDDGTNGDTRFLVRQMHHLGPSVTLWVASRRRKDVELRVEISSVAFSRAFPGVSSAGFEVAVSADPEQVKRLAHDADQNSSGIPGVEVGQLAR